MLGTLVALAGLAVIGALLSRGSALSNERLWTRLEGLEAKSRNGKLYLWEIRNLLGNSTQEYRFHDGTRHEWHLRDRDVYAQCHADWDGLVGQAFIWGRYSEDEKRERNERAEREKQDAIRQQMTKWRQEQYEALKGRYLARIRVTLGLPAEVPVGRVASDRIVVDRAYCERNFFRMEYAPDGDDFAGAKPGVKDNITDFTEAYYEVGPKITKLWEAYTAECKKIDEECAAKAGDNIMPSPVR
ncbi:MAG TPA: hypothetical protein VNE39_21850 [Planctomycetota bacterium]|nr:hypothetical protein [Planctomycetota bacterium]